MSELPWRDAPRTSVWARIDAALSSPGHRGLALVGAAGVGKTALARRLAERHSTGDRRSVLRWIGATASAADIPFGALSHLLELAPVAESATLLRAARMSLCQDVDERRMLVVVDDAQHLDELSATLLHQLMIHSQVRLVLTMRDDIEAPAAITALWKDQLVTRLDIEALSREETVELIESVLGGPLVSSTADRLFEISGGNPLFARHLVEEAVRTGALRSAQGVWQLHGTATLSVPLATLIGRQLDLLPPDARRVLQYLAIDEPLALRDLAELVGADAVEQAESAGAVTISVRGPDTVVLSGHPLYAECVRSELGVLSRRRISAELVAQIAARDPDHVSDRLRLAQLSLETDTPLGSAELLVAAWEAMRLGDLQLTETLARGALDGKESLYARLPLAHSLAWQGRGAEADEVLDAIEIDTLSETDLVAWVLPKAANQFWMRGESERARELLAQIRTRVVNPSSRDVLDALAATFALNAGEIVDARRDAERVLASDTADDLAVAWAAATAALANARMGCCEPVPALAERGLAMLPPGLLRFTIGLGQTTAALANGDVDGAEAFARQCLDFAGIRQPGRAIADILLATVLAARGALTEASALLVPSAVALAGTGYSWGPLALMVQARLLGQRGDHAQAAEVLARAEAGYGMRSAMYAPELELARAWTHAARRDLPAAVAAARRAVEVAERAGQYGVAPLAVLDSVRLGDRGVVPAAERVAARLGTAMSALIARYARALGDGDPVALEEVASEFATAGRLAAAADAAAQAAVRHGAAGAGAAQLRARGCAAKWAAACDSPATPALEQALAPLPLTERERNIAVLVADGLSNKVIAEQLCVSVRTVEGHVYRACTKLGVADRMGLAEAVSGSAAR